MSRYQGPVADPLRGGVPTHRARDTLAALAVPLALAALAALLLLLPSCGVGVDDASADGTATVVLTDAALDDLATFEVDVAGLLFHKASGATVSALPRAVRVDFTELDGIGDLVARASLEPGVYRGVTMTLDFGDATVVLAGATTRATVVDADGDPITGTVDVEIAFPSGDRPSVRPNRNHTFQLDLDLNQAVTVDTAQNLVRFLPVASVEFDPSDPRPIAATGRLASVDTGDSSFVLDKRSVDGAVVAEFTVEVTQSTVFQLSGQVLRGGNGLAGLATLDAGSRVLVQGTLNGRVLRAVAVESGAGVPGNGQDWVAGWITARDNGRGSDATLTVLGRSRVAANGSRRFHTEHSVAVELGTTRVLRRGAGNTLNTDALNVGQFVVAFGTLSGTALDARDPTGVVRLVQAPVYGVAVGVPTSNRLVLDVVRFGPVPVAEFDFDVGGLTEADADAYTLDVTGIATTGIADGSRICASGWVNPVGVLSDEDFTPVRVVNRTSEAQLLFCAWTPATSQPVLDASADAITIDVDDASARFVHDGFDDTLLVADPAPTLEPRGERGIYRIVENGSVALHFDFAAFAADLAARNELEPRTLLVTALGSFDAESQTFAASVATVVLR